MVETTIRGLPTGVSISHSRDQRNAVIFLTEIEPEGYRGEAVFHIHEGDRI